MVISKQVWTEQIRRVYFVWGLVLLVGFTTSALGLFNGYGLWYPLILVGLSSQLPFTTKNKKAMWLFIMWAVVSFLGTMKNQLDVSGGIFPFALPSPISSYAVTWLFALSIPQIITGFFLKSTFQKILGVVWVIGGIGLFVIPVEPFWQLMIVGVITGIPYLYIATRS